VQEQTRIKLEIIRVLLDGAFSVRGAKRWLKAHGFGISDKTYYRYDKTYVLPRLKPADPIIDVWMVLEPEKYWRFRFNAERKALKLLEKLRKKHGKKFRRANC